jgi:hypothetical protein
MLADLIWLNAVIATELIQVTENVSSILRQSPPPESCIRDHRRLRAHALRIAEHYSTKGSCTMDRDTISALREHLTGHQ